MWNTLLKGNTAGSLFAPGCVSFAIPSCKRSPIQFCMNRLYRGSLINRFIMIVYFVNLFQAILCCKFFKFRRENLQWYHRIHSMPVSHNRGMRRASRYHEDVIFLLPASQKAFLIYRRFYEEIEGTLWFDALKAAFFQAIVKCLRFFIVSARSVFASTHFATTFWIRDGAFTQPSVRFAMGRFDILEISSSLPSASSGITRYPDTFSRKGKRFAVRISHNCIVIIFRQVSELPRHRKPVHGMAHRRSGRSRFRTLLFCFQNCGKFPDCFF